RGLGAERGAPRSGPGAGLDGCADPHDVEVEQLRQAAAFLGRRLHAGFGLASSGHARRASVGHVHPSPGVPDAARPATPPAPAALPWRALGRADVVITTAPAERCWSSGILSGAPRGEASIRPPTSV